jgi:hypothetical protein
VWQKTPEEAFTELAVEYEAAIHTAVRTLIQRYEPDIEAWMKQNARWTDRTGNARQALHTEVEEVLNQSVTLYLSHGVDYGVFLELSHGGAYAIIGPALDYFAPKIWADVQRLFS